MGMFAIAALLFASLVLELAGATSSAPVTCPNLNITIANVRSAENATCYWNGGNLSVYTATGTSGWMHVKIVGQNGTTYLNSSSTNWCLAKLATVYMPSQDYEVYVSNGNGGGNCPNTMSTIVKFSQSSNISTPVDTTSIPVAATVPAVTNPQSSSHQQSTTIPAAPFSTNASGYAAITNSSISSGSTHTYDNLPYLILILFIYIGMFYVRRKRRRRNSPSVVMGGSRTFSTTQRGIIAQTAMASNGNVSSLINDPRYRRLLARNPRLASYLMGYAQSGRGRITRSVLYTGGGMQDSFDGM